MDIRNIVAADALLTIVEDARRADEEKWAAWLRQRRMRQMRPREEHSPTGPFKGVGQLWIPLEADRREWGRVELNLSPDKHQPEANTQAGRVLERLFGRKESRSYGTGF